MAREKLSTEIRRKQIARVVLEQIARHGMRRLSMARVARELGLVPSALYRHYSGKESMLDGVLDYVRDSLSRNVRLALRSRVGAIAQLEAILSRHLLLVQQNRSLPQIIFYSQGYGDDAARRKAIYGMLQEYLQQLAAILLAGQEAGEIRNDTDPSVLAVMFLGIIQPPILINHLGGGGYDMKSQIDRAWGLFRVLLLDSASAKNARR